MWVRRVKSFKRRQLDLDTFDEKIVQSKYTHFRISKNLRVYICDVKVVSCGEKRQTKLKGKERVLALGERTRTESVMTLVHMGPSQLSKKSNDSVDLWAIVYLNFQEAVRSKGIRFILFISPCTVCYQWSSRRGSIGKRA